MMASKKSGKRQKGKRRKKKKNADGSSRKPKSKVKGYDFGCVPHAMAVGVYDFPNDLHEAEIYGVAYGEARSDEVAQVVPVISLVAENAEPIARAFSAFNEWADVTDPDSLELTFVLRTDGTYVIALSPEPARLLRRCLGFQRTLRPLMSMVTWCKPIDSTHTSLHKIREYSRGPVAPFLFDGVVHSSNKLSLTSTAPPVRTIPNLHALLKFEATFVEEANVEQNSVAWVALQAASDASREGGEKSGHPVPVQTLNEQRTQMLRAHFPVTLERIKNSLTFITQMSELATESVRPWQVEQAVCNIVLSSELGCGPHYRDIPSSELEDTILNALRDRYEIAGGTGLSSIDTASLREQIIADGNAFLRQIRKRTAGKLQTVQTALHAASALEATSTIADSVTLWTRIR